jgi:hypothetical protein
VLLHDLDEVDLGLDLGEGVIGRWGGHASIVRRPELERRNPAC